MHDLMSLDRDIDIPLPGHVLRPGIPAPANARLSLGLGLGAPNTPTRQNQPTTTIRLISNPFSNTDFSYSAGKNGTPQLQPFQTTFDLILDSPTPTGFLSTWPPRDPQDNFSMYPTLTVQDLPPSLVSVNSPQAKADRQEKDKEVSMPGSLTPVRGRIPEPFIFGSPLPQHNVSNTQFRVAAASVLEEMNKRLREDGVDEIQSDIITKLHPHANILQNTTDCREIKPMPGVRRGEIKEKFQRLHESEFEKMEGIDALVKRRTERSPQKCTSEEEEKEKVVIEKKRKSGAITRDSIDVNGVGPRRPSAFARRASSTRVISHGRRSKIFIPGAFGSEEEEDEDARAGKRVRMDSGAHSSALEGEQKKSEQDIRLEREHEAIRKKLDANRAKRRSSAAHGGRKSGRISRGRQSILGKPKPKPSRFGFLSSAKSLVQNVWNRGKAPAPAIASSIPKPTVTNINASTKPAESKAKMGPPSLGPKKKSSIAPACPTTAIASGSRIGTRASSSTRTSSTGAVSSLGTKKTFGGVSVTSRTSSTGTSSTGTSSRFSSVTSRLFPPTASSRASSTRTSSTGAVSSLGTKKTFGGVSVASRTSSTGSSSRFSSVASRLFAPTASSLAKANGRPSSGAGGLKAVSEDQQHPPLARPFTPTSSSLAKANKRPSSSAGGLNVVSEGQEHPPLGTITNSSVLHSTDITSPNTSKIFSKPLLLPHQSGIPVKNQRIASTDSTTLARANSIQRSLTGRKPRISRSKVIARLASQRAASGKGDGSDVTGGNSGARLAPRASCDVSGRTRSSLGTKGGGAKSRASAEGKALLSAKKRARQSEYARRKSKVAAIAPLVLDGRYPVFKSDGC